MKCIIEKLTAVLLAAVLLAGCGAGVGMQSVSDSSFAASGSSGAETAAASGGEATETMNILDEATALAASPSAVPLSISPVASGTLVQKTDKAEIDYSNTTDGYIMVKYTGSTTVKLKAQVTGPSAVTYTYDLTAGKWAVFSLSDGSGSYKATVFQNVSGTKYATVTSVTFTASLENEFAPFLLPNQYVDYSNATKTVAKAKELIGKKAETVDQVQAVYDYVVNNLTYDKEKAATVKSGYLPALDTVLAQKKGICFDYAALMAGMLRSQGVPCKLVVGYAGTAYHAWINVYSEETGWVNGAIYFDGVSWKLMDPTFASSGKQSKEIMSYIGDGSHYTAKYVY
ncbi:transglutaminase domain-containing protein [Oscillibacter sp.]|uniref:transglutaminase-like domain-containing protein n=1 Tax=Oscillibacter sp. TaxID=1945593 RepID=UPI003392BBE7